METMRLLVGLASGLATAALTFGILWGKHVFPAGFIPLLLAAVASFVLGLTEESDRGLRTAFLVASPTILLGVVCLSADWHWIIVIAVAAGVCVGSSWLGYQTRLGK
jgi:hypothetical protein